LGGGREIRFVEIHFQHRRRLFGPQLAQQSVASPDCFREQIVLRGEMSIERPARQTGRQHDVVDIGSGVPAQAEQPGGMIEDFGAGACLAGGVLRHDMLMIISYDN